MTSKTSRRQPSTMVDGRQFAVAHHGTIITFECSRAGHRYTQDFSKGAPARRMGPWGVARMARYWARTPSGGRTVGGCIGVCPKCRKEEAQQQKETGL